MFYFIKLKKFISSIVLFSLLITTVILNPQIAQAEALKAPVLGRTLKKDGTNYVITLTFTNTNTRYTNMDPEGGMMVHKLFQGATQIGTFSGSMMTPSYSKIVTLTEKQMTTSYTFYVITTVTKTINGGPAQSPKSNTITVSKTDFSGGGNVITPPPVGTITPPRLSSSVKDKTVTLKWSKVTYNDCDPDSGYQSYKIYRDNSGIVFKTVPITSTTLNDVLSEADATKSHTYYVTYWCSKNINGVAKESGKSNVQKYTPATATTPATTGANDGIVVTDADIDADNGTTTGDGQSSECKAACGHPWYKFSPSTEVQEIICNMQCVILDWLGGLIAFLIKEVLQPAAL